MGSGGRRRSRSRPQTPAGPGEVDLKTEPGSDTGAEAGGRTKSASERFGSGGRKRIAILYTALIVSIIVVLQFLLNVGRGLQAPPPEESGGGAVGGSAEDVLWRLLLASVVIIVAARVVGAGMRKINQPQVVGEIIAGILLGPSALGALWPRATEVLFPSEIMPFLDLLANVGLILFMFLVGLELDFRLIRGRGHAAVWVSGASIAAPFLSGVALALVLFPMLGSGEGRFTSFGLFIGASMSITAFPVLARILTERGLYKTKLGAVTLTCAAVDDVTAWCMLAVVVTVARATGAVGALVTIGLSLAFILVMMNGVRPLMQRLARYHEERGRLSAGVLAALFVGIILSALITDRIGIHVIFGAFLLGAVMPHRPAFVREITEKVEDFAVLFLLPIFFAFSGLRTDIGRIGSLRLWLITLLVLLVASAGKWGGSTLAARVAGLEWRESSALGVLMNCRGLTELIILNIGLQLGVLPSTLFAMLVIMAVVTTIMTEPLLALHYPRDLQRQLAEQAEEDGEPADVSPPRRRILVPIANPHTARELARVATMLAGDPTSEQVQITLLRVVEPPGSGYTMAPFVQESLAEQAAESLRPLVAQIEQAGLRAIPLVVASSSVGDTIARVANQRDVDLVLVGYHRAMFGDRLLGGTVGDVLRDAEADVAVLVVPSDRRNVVALPDGARIIVPYGGGFHEDAGLDLALRLAASANAEVTLIGPASPEGESELAEQAANAYERSGVWTKPLAVEGDVAEAVTRRARNNDFLVMGVSDHWADNQESIGDIRQELVERAATPFLLVRRHGRSRNVLRRWLARLARRPQEWMEQLTHDKRPPGDGSG